MTERLIAALRRTFSIRVERIDFKDNLYHNDDFVAKSIASNFAGWYCETDLPKQIDLILQSCETDVPAKVLDAACGHGRHADLLMKNGHDVVGADISERLISYLEEKCGDRIWFGSQPIFAEPATHRPVRRRIRNDAVH